MNDPTAAVVDAPVNTGEATVKETPEVTQGTESVASENGERAGGEQSTAEGSQVDGQDSRIRRGPSKMDTIRELRGKLREQRTYWDGEMGTMRSQLDELKEMLKNRDQSQKPSKTFWEAPEEVLDDRMKGHLSEFEKRIYARLDQRNQVDQETSDWKQETSTAAEFIRTQKGITPDDMQDIRDLILETPIMQNLRPQERAEYAIFLWQKSRGITDRSSLKAQASTVVGAPPAAGGKKIWTDAEIQRELDKFPKDVTKYTKEEIQAFNRLEQEIRDAQKDGRTK